MGARVGGDQYAARPGASGSRFCAPHAAPSSISWPDHDARLAVGARRLLLARASGLAGSAWPRPRQHDSSRIACGIRDVRP